MEKSQFDKNLKFAHEATQAAEQVLDGPDYSLKKTVVEVLENHNQTEVNDKAEFARAFFPELGRLDIEHNEEN